MIWAIFGLGIVFAGIFGWGLGYGMGASRNAAEIGRLSAETETLHATVRGLMLDIEELAAAPLSGADARRVLELVADSDHDPA